MVAVVQVNRGYFLWLSVLTRVQNIRLEIILSSFFLLSVCADTGAGKKGGEAKPESGEGEASQQSQAAAKADRDAGAASKQCKQIFCRPLETTCGASTGACVQNTFWSGRKVTVQMHLVDISFIKDLACSPGLIAPRISQRLLQAWRPKCSTCAMPRSLKVCICLAIKPSCLKPPHLGQRQLQVSAMIGLAHCCLPSLGEENSAGPT